MCVCVCVELGEQQSAAKLQRALQPRRRQRISSGCQWWVDSLCVCVYADEPTSYGGVKLSAAIRLGPPVGLRCQQERLYYADRCTRMCKKALVSLGSHARPQVLTLTDLSTPVPAARCPLLRPTPISYTPSKPL